MHPYFDADKDCNNCMWYLPIGKIDLCLKWKIVIVPTLGLRCPRWESDNLHDDDAENERYKEAAETILRKE